MRIINGNRTMGGLQDKIHKIWKGKLSRAGKGITDTVFFPESDRINFQVSSV